MFWKKKKMIDVKKLRGRIFKPGKGSEIVTDRNGFVEIGRKKTEIANFPQETSFTDSSNDEYSSRDTYDKKEIDAKLERLDNLIYKLEQRIEVLERKAGVGDSGDVPKIDW